MIPNVVKLNIDVLCPLVKFRILHQSNGSLVVKVQWYWCGVSLSKFFKKAFQPDGFLGSLNVLSLRCRLGRTVLKSTSPQYGATMVYEDLASSLAAFTQVPVPVDVTKAK